MICVTNNANIVNFFGEIKNFSIKYKLVFIEYIDFLFGSIHIILVFPGFSFSELESIIFFKQFDNFVWASFGDRELVYICRTSEK